MPPCVDVSGLQSTSRFAANSRARGHGGRLSQIASSTGQFCWHHPPEPLALATPEGTLREVDLGRGPVQQPGPTAWGHQVRATCGHCALANACVHSVVEKPGREDVPDPGKQCSEHQPWEHVGFPTSREMPRLWPVCQQPGTTVEGDVGAVTLSSTGMDSRRGSIWTPEVQASLPGPCLPHGPGCLCRREV